MQQQTQLLYSVFRIAMHLKLDVHTSLRDAMIIPLVANHSENKQHAASMRMTTATTGADIKKHARRAFGLACDAPLNVTYCSHDEYRRNQFEAGQIADTDLIGSFLNSVVYLWVQDLRHVDDYYVVAVVDSSYYVRLRVNGSMTVGALRDVVRRECGDDCELVFQVSDDSLSISSVGIYAGIHLVVRSLAERCYDAVPLSTDARTQIFVKSLYGTSISVLCDVERDTAQALRQRYSDISNVPVNQMRLIFAGRHLDEVKTLAQHKIGELSTVHCVLRLRGGMMHETSGRSNFEATLPVHRHYVCNHCGAYPLCGKRYTCTECVNVDICERCEAMHDDTHVLEVVRE
jgi:hypothetical protein